jgi:hypothetical protein
MAKILAFRPVELRHQDSAGEARDASLAEVILFPGVRYERWNDATATGDGSARSKNGHERDILELAE